MIIRTYLLPFAAAVSAVAASLRPALRPLVHHASARSQAGIGAKYGTRDPATCARGAGPRGTPSVGEVAQRVRCDREGESSYSVTLVENLRVEVARPRAYVHVQDSWEDIDPRQPLYPVRGSLTVYSCNLLTGPNGHASDRGKNCSYWQEPRAEGACFRDHFGDLHCKLYDHKADLVTGSVRNVPPPR